MFVDVPRGDCTVLQCTVKTLGLGGPLSRLNATLSLRCRDRTRSAIGSAIGPISLYLGSTRRCRRAPDYTSNLCPPKTCAIFFQGVFWASYTRKQQEGGPKHPRKVISEDAMGGWKKEGGWKTSRMTPLPKRGFGPPRTVRFPPPSGVSALFFLYKNPRQSRPEALLEGSKNFRESAFSGTFSSPHTFCTPPYHRPII